MKKKKKNNSKIVVVFATILVLTIVVTVVAYNYLPNMKEEVLRNLPEKPDDFIYWRNQIEKTYIKDVCDIGKEYYLQPDFYPGWSDHYESNYKNHDYSRWGTQGFGTYPSYYMLLRNLRKDAVIEKCTFLHVGSAIETWQGLKLIPAYSENARNKNGSYFNVEIETYDDRGFESHVLLPPTFPEINPSWVQKVKIKVTTLQDIPPGRYTVGFNGDFTTPAFSKMVNEEILARGAIYDESYVDNCKKDLPYRNKAFEGLKGEGLLEECERLMWERQNRYFSQGVLGTSTNTFSMTIEVQ